MTLLLLLNSKPCYNKWGFYFVHEILTEVLNLVRAKIEGSPEGKALLDSQLKLVKNLKTSIIEMSQREMQLFNAFKEASAKNPSLTYDEFIKTMK